MPYKHEKKQPFNLTESEDARCKYSKEDKDDAKFLSELGLSQRAISRITGMSRRLISFILDPQKEVISKAQFKERRKDNRYYDKEKHRVAIKATRLKKHKILKEVQS